MSKLEGYLEKRSDWTRTWQKRYFVYEAGELKYYVDKADAKPKGTIRLGKCSLAVKSDAKLNAFVLTDASGKNIFLACIDSSKTDIWIDGLNRIALAIVKDGAYKSVDVKFGEGSLGIRLSPDNRIDSCGCGIVKGMRSDSPASVAGVKVGDTLMKVNDVDVSFGVSSFENALSLIKKAPRPVTLRFARVEKVAAPPTTPVKQTTTSSTSKTPSSARSDTSTTSLEGATTVMAPPTPCPKDLESGEKISEKDHERWLVAVETYNPRVEIVDPEAVAARRGSITTSSHVEYRVVTTTRTEVSASNAKILAGKNTKLYVGKGKRSVLRRYRDFLWLHNVLTKRYVGMSVPAIPLKRRRLSSSLTLFNELKASKQAFISERMTLLQLFLERVLESPYLRTDSAVDEFLRVQDRSDFENVKARYDNNDDIENCKSHEMWTSNIKFNMPRWSRQGVGGQTEGDRSATELSLQIDRLLAAMQSFLKAVQKMSLKLDAESDRHHDSVVQISKWIKAEEKCTKSDCNEYVVPQSENAVRELKSLMEFTHQSKLKRKERSSEFDSNVYIRLKYAELELRGMQTLLQKRKELLGKFESASKKAKRLSVNAEFDDKKKELHLQALEEKKSLEFSIQFLDTAVLTYSAKRFREKSKESILKMFAELASSGLRRAKESEMTHTGLINKLNASVKKDAVRKIGILLDSEGEKLPTVVRSCVKDMSSIL
jgi:hypothetical protein